MNDSASTWHWVVCDTCTYVDGVLTDRVSSDIDFTILWMQKHAEVTGHDGWRGSESVVTRYSGETDSLFYRKLKETT